MNIIIPGDWSRWVINDEISNRSANIRSFYKGLINITGIPKWEYHAIRNNGHWHYDNTLKVTGEMVRNMTEQYQVKLL